MEKEGSGCGCSGRDGECPACGMDAILSYWCDSCRRSVPDKRCPHCGLKAKRKKLSP
ncbi:hypothetical protein L4X63_05240 [Geomonas sp. Red32]|uniref:hypothetical protein n=1 Tax=Geomonas sp. Red32 TaxID=2912856 RepID=UPI00202CBA27|nr:hypothetical protein [Geomonas sp. Red32]MCM0080987.1 hypothetical protein [Geomonas sp. Red32]